MGSESNKEKAGLRVSRYGREGQGFEPLILHQMAKEPWGVKAIRKRQELQAEKAREQNNR